MQHVAPFATVDEALAALDNGGRFFNLWQHAGDGVVGGPELATAAGTLGGGPVALLWLHLALSHLAEADRAVVIAKLEPDLAQRWHRLEPLTSAADVHGGPGGRPAVLEGALTLADPADVAALHELVSLQIGPTPMIVPSKMADSRALGALVDASGTAIVSLPTGWTPSDPLVRVAGQLEPAYDDNGAATGCVLAATWLQPVRG